MEEGGRGGRGGCEKQTGRARSQHKGGKRIQLGRRRSSPSCATGGEEPPGCGRTSPLIPSVSISAFSSTRGQKIAKTFPRDSLEKSIGHVRVCSRAKNGEVTTAQLRRSVNVSSTFGALLLMGGGGLDKSRQRTRRRGGTRLNGENGSENRETHRYDKKTGHDYCKSLFFTVNSSSSRE